jgi:hypothetical protein
MDPESGTPQIISQEWQRCIELSNELRTKNLLCDTVLRLEDGIFPVHRLILSVRSEHFMTLFTTPLHCTERTDVLLPGVTSETMTLILEYVYMRSVDINQENVCTLLISADYLRMSGLLELCRNFLESMLTPENCIGIMRFPRVYSSCLEGDACCFVMRNFVQVSQQSDEMLELTPEELKAMQDNQAKLDADRKIDKEEMKANQSKADADRKADRKNLKEMMEKMDDIKEIKEEMKANQAKMEANMGSMQAELKSTIEDKMKDTMQSMRSELDEDIRHRIEKAITNVSRETHKLQTELTEGIERTQGNYRQQKCLSTRGQGNSRKT